MNKCLANGIGTQVAQKALDITGTMLNTECQVTFVPPHIFKRPLQAQQHMGQ